VSFISGPLSQGALAIHVPLDGVDVPRDISDEVPAGTLEPQDQEDDGHRPVLALVTCGERLITTGALPQ